MNIVEAPNMIQYSDPTQWIRTRVLPTKRTCGVCKSKLVIDHESDLRLNSSGSLAYDCMVCGSGCVIKRPSDEDMEQHKKSEEWLLLSDEEYEKVRAEAILNRAKTREKYLAYGSNTLRSIEFGIYNSYSRISDYQARGIPMPSYEQYIEETYLPAVPPETRPNPLSNLELLYDDVVAYYKKQQKNVVTKAVEKTPMSSSDMVRIFHGFAIVFGIVGLILGSYTGIVPIVAGIIGLFISHLTSDAG